MTSKNFKVKNGIDVGTVENAFHVQDGLLRTKGGNITMGITHANTIDTGTGNLTITSAGGTTTVDDNLTVNGTLNDGTTNLAATFAELNIMDGGTSATSTTLADADRVVVNDAGTMKQVALTDFETYFESALDTLSNVTTVGALNSGSITSGFGAIDNGSSAITTTGTVTYGSLSDGTITITAFVDEDNMASNSATLVPTQQSVKAYVDGEIGNLSSTTLQEGNSTLIVSDSGANGTLTFTADGNTELEINDTSATFSGNVIVTGNLNVNGTTTTVATSNTVVSDSLIELANGTTGTPANDAGIVIERGDSNNAFIGFDESEDKFKMGTGTFTGASTGNLTISTGTLVANLEGNVTGAVTGNASTATTATNVTVTANNATNETVYITFVDGATGTQGIETDTGLSYNPSTNVLSTTASAAQYSDLAERFHADAEYDQGTVMMMGGNHEVTQCDTELCEHVFGVVSSVAQAGFTMNTEAGTDATHPLIALAGRVDVKVTGTVAKGDRLVSSGTPGVARRAQPGEATAFNVIGRALEDNDSNEIAVIKAFVVANR